MIDLLDNDAYVTISRDDTLWRVLAYMCYCTHAGFRAIASSSGSKQMQRRAQGKCSPQCSLGTTVCDARLRLLFMYGGTLAVSDAIFCWLLPKLLIRRAEVVC